MGVFAGFKPNAKPGEAEDLYSPEDFANLLSAFPGGTMVAPPEPMTEG